MTESEEKESSLLSLAQSGDRHALERLLSEHHEQVYRFGLRMCGNPEDAKDVVQNTLLAAAQKLPEFRGDASLSTWLYTIAKRFCGRRNRRDTRAGITVPLEETHSTDLLGSPERSVPSPEEQVAGTELREALSRAILALSEELREVLVLRDIQGLTTEETAKVAELSVEATKSRLHRARLALRKLLQPEFRLSGEQRTLSDASVLRKCPDIAELFSRHLEGEVTPDVCAAMQSHLDGCERCQATCSTLRRTLAICQTELRSDPVPAPLEGEIDSLIRSASAEKPAAPSGGPSKSPR